MNGLRIGFASYLFLTCLGVAAEPTSLDVRKSMDVVRRWRKVDAATLNAAIETLGRSGSPEAVPSLAYLLGHGFKTRQRAISALVSMGESAIPGLIDVLKARDEAMTMHLGLRRDEVIGCMEVFRRMDPQLQREHVIPALKALMDESADYDPSEVRHGSKPGAPKASSEFVWMNAVDCLAALGPQAAPVLAEALKAGFHEDVLAEKIGRLAADAYPAIQQMNTQPDASAREGWQTFFSRALTEPGPDRVPSILSELGDDEHGYLPYLAMLLERAGPESVPALTKALADTTQDSYVRDGVSLALQMMGPDGKAALPALEKVFQDRTDDILVRVGAARAMAAIKEIAPAALYSQIPGLEDEVIAATRERSMAWRKAYLKREGARKDMAPYSEEPVAVRWNTTGWWVHAMTSGENLKAANASLRVAARSGNIGSFMDVNSVRVFVTCHSKSPFFPGRLEPETEQALKEYFFNHCENGGHASTKPGVGVSTDELEAWVAAPDDAMVGHNHNISMNHMTRDYLALGVLKDDPAYKDREFKVGDTIQERYAAYNAFLKRFLKDWALNGLWVELASSAYTYHTYPSYFNLADLAPDPEVRRRARMWLDLSFVESAQMSISRIRAGSRCRAKRGGLGDSFDSYAGFLYGERGATRYHGSIAASAYQPPEAAVLLRKLGPTTPCFEVANRHHGERLHFTDPDIKDAKGNPRKQKKALKYSRCINYGYCTPEYVMGCAMYDPNLEYGSGSSGRWSGITFRDLGAIYMHAYSGEKWNVQSKDVMIAQRRTGTYYKYKGRSEIIFESGLDKIERDGWIFVDNGEAYAAVNVVRGGTFWADPIKRKLYPHDDYSPIIFQTGLKADYGSFETFQQAVLKAPLELEDGKLTYQGPNASKLAFTLATSEGEQIRPAIDGKPIDLDLEYSYKSPYMESKVGSETVTVRYGDRTWLYDFTEVPLSGSDDNKLTNRIPGSRVD